MEPRHILNYIIRKLHKELARNENNFHRMETGDIDDVIKQKALQKFVTIPIIFINKRELLY